MSRKEGKREPNTCLWEEMSRDIIAPPPTLSVNLGNTEKRARKDRCTWDATLGFLTGGKKGTKPLKEGRRAWLTGGS